MSKTNILDILWEHSAKKHTLVSFFFRAHNSFIDLKGLSLVSTLQLYHCHVKLLGELSSQPADVFLEEFL